MLPRWRALQDFRFSEFQVFTRRAAPENLPTEPGRGGG
jgi:hypothetical protein